MTDEAFDAMWLMHVLDRQQQPGHDTWDDTILNTVGAVFDGEKLEHRTKMYSLDNVFVETNEEFEKLSDWYNKMPDSIRERASNIAIEPKIDGLSANLWFQEGELVAAITRGDGTKGQVITENVLVARLLPNNFPTFPFGDRDCEIRGEIFIRESRLGMLNEQRKAEGKEPYANVRNAAAGIVMQKDSSKVRNKYLEFIVHGIILGDKPVDDLYHIKEMHVAGWYTMWGLSLVVSPQNLANGAIFVVEDVMRGLDLPTDGLVVKLLDLECRDELGYTSRAPRWATAIKLKQPTEMTRVTDITIQVGRNGTLTPVAELEPTQLDGSVVSRATLHNQDQINRLGLIVGDMVELRKAGGIIPEIVRVVYTEDFGKGCVDRGNFSIVDYLGDACPACSQALNEYRSATPGKGESVKVECPNNACPAQLTGLLVHAFGRDGLNINLGEAACVALANSKEIYHPFDILSWSADRFAELAWVTEEGKNMSVGSKRAVKVVESIEAAKKLPLHNWIYALGINNVGKNTSKELAKHYPTVDAILQACAVNGDLYHATFDAEYEEIKLAKGFSGRLGPATIRSIVEYTEQSYVGDCPLNYGPISLIPESVVTPEEEPVVEGKYTGKKFAITGKLSLPRTEIVKVIESLGGEASSSLTKACDFLVVGEKAGSKLAKAKTMGITILTEAELINNK